MEDQKIVELYWERSETAISETQNKYGNYCYYIAYHILYSHEDSEECVNDTYLKAWEAMPPHKPSKLSVFLGKITRNLSLDRYDKKMAQKRMTSTHLILDEMEECIPDTSTSRDLTEEIVLRDAINAFLKSLTEQTRIVFMRRYWYLCSVSEISGDLGLSESNVKIILHRTRKKFKEFLEKEGILI